MKAFLATIPLALLVSIVPAKAEVDRHGAHGWTANYPSNGYLGTYSKRQKPVVRHRHGKSAVVAKHRKSVQVAAADAAGGFGSSNLVAEARRYLGGNPTGRSSLWCADFMNLVLQRTGHRGTGSRMARDFASYGTRISGPQVGAIAVMSRGRRGGHVGIVSGISANGNPIIISGNDGRLVRERERPTARIYAYVVP